MLLEMSVVSDRFHVCNHTCIHVYNANSYGELDVKSTLTHEQRNASIRKMEAVLRGAGRYGYLALICYQTSVLNSFSESQWAYKSATGRAPCPPKHFEHQTRSAPPRHAHRSRTHPPNHHRKGAP